MLASTRISLTYKVGACTILALAGSIAYSIWLYQPDPETLGELLRPIGLMLVIVAGLGQACMIATDPLARRVVRFLRYKSM